MQKQILGFIGGTGLYEIDILKNRKIHRVKSSWGFCSDKIIEGKINNQKIFFLSRHGKGHKLSPTSINYRANIDSLKKLGVTDILSISAVGSLKKKLDPGTFVVVDQFIDRTISREKSFFNKGIIAHVPLSHPTSKVLMNLACTSLKDLKINYQKGGTYIAMEGPQFSTKAESNLYRSWNADVIGMTNMPEAKLAREAEIRYCSISMVTDYDCWYEDYASVDLKILMKNLKKNSKNAINFIKNFSIKYSEGLNFSNDTTANILDTSIVTQKKYWDSKIEKKLNSILKRYKKDNK